MLRVSWVDRSTSRGSTPERAGTSSTSSNVIASPMIKYRGPFVLELPKEAWFDVNMMQKDLNLALAMGQQLKVPLPTTATTNEFLTAARGMGFAAKDFAVIFDVLAHLSGVQR